MDLATFRADVARLVRDGGGVLADPADYDFFLREAVKRYSRIRPRVIIADLVGDGGWELALPAAFDPDRGRLREVEYPVGRRDRSMVDTLDWELYRAPDGPVLRLRADTPDVGEAVRVTFTAQHTLDAAETSVPVDDHDVVNLVASAIACEALASHYSNAGDSTIGADSVDHKSKASEYAMRARRFMAMANELLPVDEQGDIRASGGETSFGDEQGWLTHPAR